MVAGRDFTAIKLTLVATAFLAFACGKEPVSSPAIRVRINEVCSSNHVLQNLSAPQDDWIELYNLNSTPANLEGYYISDDVDTRFVQVLPADAVVPGNGVLLLWADGQSKIVLDEIHLNFKLSADGEGVWFSNPQGYLVDSIEFGAIPPNDAQTEETVLARFPDGTGPFQWCSVFTPHEVNGDHCLGQSL